jgi:hypothetical protein
MDKSEAMQLLNEICAVCPEVAVAGFYLKEIKSLPPGKVELRLMTQLSRESSKYLDRLVTKRRLTLIKANELLIIY